MKLDVIYILCVLRNIQNYMLSHLSLKWEHQQQNNLLATTKENMKLYKYYFKFYVSGH